MNTTTEYNFDFNFDARDLQRLGEAVETALQATRKLITERWGIDPSSVEERNQAYSVLSDFVTIQAKLQYYIRKQAADGRSRHKRRQLLRNPAKVIWEAFTRHVLNKEVSGSSDAPRTT